MIEYHLFSIHLMNGKSAAEDWKHVEYISVILGPVVLTQFEQQENILTLLFNH